MKDGVIMPLRNAYESLMPKGILVSMREALRHPNCCRTTGTLEKGFKGKCQMQGDSKGEEPCI